MKNLRKIIFIVFSIAIVMPFYFYKGEANTLPSSYKLTDHITITPKDQGWYNDDYMLCWAFSSLNALETNIQLKSNGQQNPYFSVRHLDYLSSSYFYGERGVNRRLGDVGSFSYTLRYLLNNDGPVLNDKSELTKYPIWNANGVVTNGCDYIDEDLTRDQVSEIANYTPEYYVHKIANFPSIRKNNGVGTYVTIDKQYEQIETGDQLTEEELTANRNNIKQHIMENGGVTCLVNPYTRKYDSNGIAYLYGAQSGGGHMTTIVGWDDNLDISERTNGQLNPPGKGAYLILDSYGYHYGGNRANDGLEWVSYYDADVELCNFGYVDVDQTPVIITASFSNSTAYNTVLQELMNAMKNSTVAQCAYKYNSMSYYPLTKDYTNKKLTMSDLVVNTYSIDSIELSSRSITSKDVEEIAKVAPNLKELSISQNKLLNIDGIASLSKLTTLKARENKIEDISAIKDVLDGCTEVQLQSQKLYRTIINTEVFDYPNLFLEAKNPNSKVYSESGFSYINCEENSDGTGIRIIDRNRRARIKVKSGNAEESELIIDVADDTAGPKLVSLNVINPDTGSYQVGQEILITATFDEDIYAKVDGNWDSITSSTAPQLTIKFGNGTTRQATFVNVGPREINYKVIIEDNDEGVLTSVGFEGTVFDEVGDLTNFKSETLGGNTITATKFKKGDVTGDGNVNIRDIIKIRKYIANLTKWDLTDSEKLRADVDENDRINIRDIIKIRKYIAASSSETIRTKHPDWMW